MTQQTRILLIDDDYYVRDSLAAYLDVEGYLIAQADGAESGLELFQSLQPDLVMCDIRMPGQDGLSVLKTIRTLNADVPVIMMSASGLMSDVVTALREGASDYLDKPIRDMAVLDLAVKRALEQGELKRENRVYRQQLEQANLELRESLAVLEQDQQAGRQVQFKMLPPSQRQYGGYLFKHMVAPSLYLSGDFIDYFSVVISSRGRNERLTGKIHSSPGRTLGG